MNAHLDDINQKFSTPFIDINNNVLNISNCVSKYVVFQKPDGTSLYGSGLFSTDGTDGSLYYVTQPNDLDQVGFWRYQGQVTFSNGGTLHTDVFNFRVMPDLPTTY